MKSIFKYIEVFDIFKSYTILSIIFPLYFFFTAFGDVVDGLFLYSKKKKGNSFIK